MKTLFCVGTIMLCIVLDMQSQEIFFDESKDRTIKINKIAGKKFELNVLIRSKVAKDTSVKVVLPKLGDAVYDKDYKGNEEQTYVFNKDETEKKRYYVVEITDSSNVGVSFPIYLQNKKGDIIDIIMVKINKDTSKYEIGPIVFSVGAAFSIDSRRIDNKDLYTDFRFTKYDFLCKKLGVDAGFSSAVSTITEPDNSAQFSIRRYYPSIREERQHTVSGTVDRSFKVGSTAAWLSAFWKCCNGLFGGFHFEYRCRNLLQTNEMKPFDSSNVFSIEHSNGNFLDTVKLSPFSLTKSTSVTEGLFGICFGTYYSTNKYEAFIKATVGGRVQSNVQKKLDTTSTSRNGIFFNEFDTRDIYFGWGIQFRLLEKTFGIKFGGEIRGIGLLRPDMFLYIAKEFNILRLGDVLNL